VAAAAAVRRAAIFMVMCAFERIFFIAAYQFFSFAGSSHDNSLGGSPGPAEKLIGGYSQAPLRVIH
jgi:hypothetical protein